MLQPGPFVHAIYRDEPAAVEATRALIDAKFPSGDVGAFMRGMPRGTDSEIEVQHKTGIPVGAMLGAALGALGGALVASGVVLAAGPVLLALDGAAAGGALGSLTGALAGLAHWSDTLSFPAHTFDHGGVLLGVTTHEGRVEEARDILTATGGEDVRVSTKRRASIAAADGDSATLESRR